MTVTDVSHYFSATLAGHFTVYPANAWQTASWIDIDFCRQRRDTTVKRLGVVLAWMCAIAPAYGVQEVTLKDLPPLQPLHWCKHSDGQVTPQSEPCASDTTEVSSWMKRQPDGTMAHVSLEEGKAMDAPDKTTAGVSAATGAQSGDVKQSPLGDFWKHMGKWVGFAILVGLVAKFLKQSFVLWAILGFVLRAVLVAMNVIAF